MTDRRSIPDPARITRRLAQEITRPVVDLCAYPGGPRDRQLLLGDHVTDFGAGDGWCYVQALRDGYCGFVRAATLGAPHLPSHRVTARASHAYCAPDIKSGERLALSFGARLEALSETATFIETAHGFVPRQHVHRLSDHAEDPLAIAQLFLGAPYLWGGNSHAGLDCSGLIQAALLACNLPCPGDSDQQLAQLGAHVLGKGDYRKNDLLFWKGHVALVLDPQTIIHANAAHMAVVQEPIQDALDRIEIQGDGPLIGHKRL